MGTSKRRVFLKSASRVHFRRPLEHLSRPHIARDIGLRSWPIFSPKNSQKLTKIHKNSQKLTKIPKTLDLLFSGWKIATDMIKGSTKIYSGAQVQPCPLFYHFPTASYRKLAKHFPDSRKFEIWLIFGK